MKREDKHDTDYKLYGFELFMHRIAQKVELLGDMLFESAGRQEGVFHMLLMSVLGLGSLVFIMNESFNDVLRYFDGFGGAITTYVFITFLYYFAWQIGSRFRTYLLASTLPVVFTIFTIYIYTYLKNGLYREGAAEEYGVFILIEFSVLSLLFGICDNIIVRVVKKVRCKKTKKDIQRAFQTMYSTLVENEPENVSYDEISKMNDRYNLGFTEKFMKKTCK